MSGAGRLRIAYVVSRLEPGGAERQMLALAERLPADEFGIDFICTSQPGLYEARARDAGARVFSLGEHPRAGLSERGLAMHRMHKVLGFISTAQRHAYDIIDAWMYPMYDLAALTRPLTGVPIVIAGRRNLREPERRYGAVELVVDALARRLCDMTVANSSAAAERAVKDEKLAPSKVRLIRNGVEPIADLDPIQRETIRARWGASPEAVVVGCVANYRAIKRQDVLIRAMARVLPRHPDAKLVLVGEGEARGALEELITSLGMAGSVILHGSEPDARRLYGAFDIVVLTSASEGLPNALIEAGAAALPVIATAVGGVPEIVDDGVTGLLVRSGNGEALAAGLSRLVEDAALRTRMGKTARAHITGRFGIDRFVGEFRDLYRELAERKGLPWVRPGAERTG